MTDDSNLGPALTRQRIANTLRQGNSLPPSIVVITSKLTSKAQTTVPQPVRAALNLQPGDELEYYIEAGRVILTRHADEPADDPFRTFDEWHSQADADAYADL
jgi:antitoxin PrlF